MKNTLDENLLITNILLSLCSLPYNGIYKDLTLLHYILLSPQMNNKFVGKGLIGILHEVAVLLGE